MENKNIKKISLIITISVFLIIGIVVFILMNNKTVISESDAKLIGNNSILYTQVGCGHCLIQEQMFGENIKYLNVVDCFKEENRKECSDKEIVVTPTWLINNIKYEGVKSLKELKEILKENGIQ